MKSSTKPQVFGGAIGAVVGVLIACLMTDWSGSSTRDSAMLVGVATNLAGAGFLGGIFGLTVASIVLALVQRRTGQRK